MQTIAESLGAYAASLRYEDLPQDVVAQTKRFIIDTLGCAFGGYDSEPAEMARELATTVSSSQPVTILCSGQKTSADLAVFANAVMIRYLDFNDGYNSKGSGHPSDSIAALLGAGVLARAGGRDLIAATVVAYEVYCGMCDTWNNILNGIDSVTQCGLASAAGAARLLRLPTQQITEAINLTVAANIALNQTRVGAISGWKACAAAYAGRNAIFATQLAARGMTGPTPIFEGRNGFFKVLGAPPFELAPFGGSGRPFRIMHCHLKQFPLGNYAQTVVTAALEAKKLVTDIHEISEIRIHVSDKALNIMADDPAKWHPDNPETADHSMPYTAGVALMYGTITRHHFGEQYLRDKELLALISRIKCVSSEEANRRAGETYLCDFEIVLRSGKRQTVRVEYHRGHWRNPMSDAEIEAKFRSLCADLIPAARADALLERLWKLESVDDIETLLQMTQRTQLA